MKLICGTRIAGMSRRTRKDDKVSCHSFFCIFFNAVIMLMKLLTCFLLDLAMVLHISYVSVPRYVYIIIVCIT